MKLTANKSAGFITQPDKTLRVFLLYGPDAGLVRERAQKLALHFVDDLNDPFSVSELTGAMLDETPSRLADEMATMSLMGGRRLVRVKDAGQDAVFRAVDALLQATPMGNNIAILEAGELDKRSKLRNRVEDDSLAIAIPCYAEEGLALSDTVRGMLQSDGFGIDRDALTALLAALPPDRIGVRMEMEKLVSYAFKEPNKKITLEHVTACITDASGEEVDDAVWAAASGDIARLDKTLAKLAAEGVQPVPFLRAAMRHLTRIYEGLSRMQEEGMGAMEVVKSMKPPIFFKREAAMQAQLRKWTPAKVMEALATLLDAEIKCKTTGLPAERIGERALYNVARLGR